MSQITLTRLNKHYGQAHHAVRDLDLHVAEKEFVALVGPSGCGKSTTLRMIAGLEDVSAGEIRIGDRVVNDLPPRERDIAMVFQSYALYQHMTVYDNLAFGLRNRKLPEAADQGRDRPRRGDPGPGRADAAPAAPALGRAAATRRARALHRAPPPGVPLRRTALQPRREAAHADAPRDQALAAPRADDVGVRHARSGRGDDARRPRRHHERRPHPAGRNAAGGLRPAGEQVRRRLHRRAVDELHSRHAA